MKKIKAAGGVLVRKNDQTPFVLLIRRNGVWDLPKGQLEDDETIEECAVREVAEETGSEPPALKSFLCETYHEYTRNGIYFGKTTYWYEMEAVQVGGYTPQEKEGITELRWVTPDEAMEMVGYENLKFVLKSFIQAN